MSTKKRHNRLTFAQQSLLFCVPLVLGSCSVFSTSYPPMRYLDVVFVCGPSGSGQDAAGLMLTVENTSTQVIRELELDFFLWKHDAPYPEPGRNRFIRVSKVPISPGEQETLHFNLDDVFFFIPVGPLVLDRLHLSRVVLGNGTVWTDRLGLYAYPHEVVVEEYL